MPSPWLPSRAISVSRRMAGTQQVFDISGLTGDRRGNGRQRRPAGLGGDETLDVRHSLGPSGLALDDAALADGLAPGLELRLHQEGGPGARRGEGEGGG